MMLFFKKTMLVASAIGLAYLSLVQYRDEHYLISAILLVPAAICIAGYDRLEQTRRRRRDCLLEAQKAFDHDRLKPIEKGTE